MEPILLQAVMMALVLAPDLIHFNRKPPKFPFSKSNPDR
jgi:hypothetical protein